MPSRPPAADPAAARAPTPAGERIAKLLARAGIASRREVERMIAEGRIALNGVAIDTPATLLSTLDGVTVDGRPVAAPAPARLLAYHKPAGLLVTERDPAGRPTIYDRLPAGLPRVVPVGRLDLNTEGLLLLTTDGGLKRALELPATGVERTYRARAYGPISQEQLEELIHGIEIEGVRYGPIDANLERRTGANTRIELTLTEGKNREVRRVLEHLGLEVSRLIRTRYGPILLGDLPPGVVAEVRPHDVATFRQSLTRGKGGDKTMRAALQPVPELMVEAAPPPPPEPTDRRPPRGRATAPAGRGPAPTRGQPARRESGDDARPARLRERAPAGKTAAGAGRAPRKPGAARWVEDSPEPASSGGRRGRTRPDARATRDQPAAERPLRADRKGAGRPDRARPSEASPARPSRPPSRGGGGGSGGGGGGKPAAPGRPTRPRGKR